MSKPRDTAPQDLGGAKSPVASGGRTGAFEGNEAVRFSRKGLGITRVLSEDSRSQGLVHLYDGDGKGKSMAALGVALRSIGLGIHNPGSRSRVMLVRFLKATERSYDEDGAIALLQYKFPHLIDVSRCGRADVTADLSVDDVTEVDISEVERGWAIAKGAILSGLYSVVILDEICPLFGLGLLTLKEVLDFLASKPEGVEVILTGRSAPQRLRNIVDLHSEFTPRKETATIAPLAGFTVVTGNGKGKSTSALGRVLRSLGRSILCDDFSPVLLVQFLKGGTGYTEEPAINAIQVICPDLLGHVRCGRGEIVWWNDRRSIDYSEAERGWDIAANAISSGEFHTIVLDELNSVMDLALLDADLVYNTIAAKPDDVELIVTGRATRPPRYFELAEVYCNVAERRHYMENGKAPRQGIDF